jgi:hypothetical protein
MSFKPMWRYSKPLALPETGPASSGARQHNHGPRPLLALDSQHGKSRRQQHGRGVGIESTVDKASDKNIGGFPFCGVCRKTREPTSGLEPLSCSLRVIIHVLLGFARACKSRISKRLSLLRVATRCTVLRFRWCQSGVNSIYLLNSRYRASLQAVLQDAGCRPRRGTKHFYRNASASSHI